jgi:16S rRNA (uracil1498-N3)-methyltransferase
VHHPRFFSPQPLPRPPSRDDMFEVNEDIARHFQVLRLGADDDVTLFDGLGGEWSATIAHTGKRAASLRLLTFDPVERESPLRVTLVQGLAGSDKMDLIVQKAVELGVSAIQPVASERATLKLSGDRAQKRTQHWRGVAQAACEQCGRNRIPHIADLIGFDAWLAMPDAGHRLLLQPGASTSLVESVEWSRPLALLIGPEGGFSPTEIMLARSLGASDVMFGPRVLRTETAGLAALAALNAIHGDLR